MRKRATVRSVLHIAVCVLTLAWIACGSEESKPAPKTSPADAGAATETEDAPTPPMPDTPPAPDAEFLITDGVIPEGFPSDVSVYPRGMIGPAMAIPGAGFLIFVVSDDDPSAVLDHYRTSLADSGWSVSEVPDIGHDATKVGLDATKDSRSVQIRARENEAGKTEIAVNIDES